MERRNEYVIRTWITEIIPVLAKDSYGRHNRIVTVPGYDKAFFTSRYMLP